jgi:hypothetical protein
VFFGGDDVTEASGLHLIRKERLDLVRNSEFAAHFLAKRPETAQ